jgi:hypothetical protein
MVRTSHADANGNVYQLWYTVSTGQWAAQNLMTVPNTVPGDGPEGYAFCAGENGTCSFSGTQNVAYGANGEFVFKTVANGIACNNATFGDPCWHREGLLYRSGGVRILCGRKRELQL